VPGRRMDQHHGGPQDVFAGTGRDGRIVALVSGPTSASPVRIYVPRRHPGAVEKWGALDGENSVCRPRATAR
jgi:hypothetical protein